MNSGKSADIDQMAKIRERAYAIWLDQGQVHDRDKEHWREAELEITKEASNGGVEPARDETPSVATTAKPKAAAAAKSKTGAKSAVSVKRAAGSAVRSSTASPSTRAP